MLGSGFGVSPRHPRGDCHTPFQHWHMAIRNRVRRALLRLADAIIHTPFQWNQIITTVDGDHVATVEFTETRTGYPGLLTTVNDDAYRVESEMVN